VRIHDMFYVAVLHVKYKNICNVYARLVTVLLWF